MSQITIIIETDNAAFHNVYTGKADAFVRADEVGRILSEMKEYYRNHPDMRDAVTFNDYNGNCTACMIQDLDPEDIEEEEEEEEEDN